MAESIAHTIMETYRGPKKTFNEIEGLVNSDAMAPLRAFSEACRNELRTLWSVFLGEGVLERLTKWLLAMVFIAVAAAGGYAWYLLRPAGIPRASSYSNGRIEATEIDIATKYAGRIDEVLVREGDTVNAGQVVARMDAGAYRPSFMRLKHRHSRRATPRQRTKRSKRLRKRSLNSLREITTGTFS